MRPGAVNILHHIITVWTAEYIIDFDIEDEAAHAPRMDVSSDKTTWHHNPGDQYLNIHHHKKCVAIFRFSAGTKCVYDSRICLELLLIWLQI